MSIKTFIDSGVLISAWQGDPSRQIKALTILSDPNRAFVCSPFVRLELIPKATYFRNQSELKFYQEYFHHKVDEWVNDLSLLYDEGMQVGSKFGLRALDAMHVSAALHSHGQEFVTIEKPTSPFSRVIGISVLTLY